mmetsp:Transcript_53458/g.140295  ORF Transcript_53458/g.140295 Transcript_53458/m.140295 type:complete len:229 (+) Transcript_53458:157-843(+)
MSATTLAPTASEKAAREPPPRDTDRGKAGKTGPAPAPQAARPAQDHFGLQAQMVLARRCRDTSSHRRPEAGQHAGELRQCHSGKPRQAGHAAEATHGQAPWQLRQVASEPGQAHAAWEAGQAHRSSAAKHPTKPSKPTKPTKPSEARKGHAAPSGDAGHLGHRQHHAGRGRVDRRGQPLLTNEHLVVLDLVVDVPSAGQVLSAPAETAVRQVEVAILAIELRHLDRPD